MTSHNVYSLRYTKMNVGYGYIIYTLRGKC